MGIGTDSGGATGSSDGGPINLTAPQIELSSLPGMEPPLFDIDTTPGLYTTNQPIAIQGNVTLNSPITLATGSAPITVTGLVDGNHPLILNTGTGNISITESIGSVNPIADLTVNSTGIATFGGPISAANLTTNAGGTTQLNGNVTTTGATGQVYGNNVLTTGDITLTGNALTFGGTVSGTGNLTFNTGTIETLPGSADVIIEATNDITIANLAGGYLTFQAGTGSITFTADADGNKIGSFVMEDINDTILAPGRNLSISGASITTGTLNTGAINGGSITLTATNGSIQTGNLITKAYASSGVAGNGGAVTLNATAGITTTGWIDSISESTSSADSSDGGNITLITSSGDIEIQSIIHSASISNFGASHNGGNVVLQAPNGSIYTNGISTASRSWNGTASGNGGYIDIEAGNLFRISSLLTGWGIGTVSGSQAGLGMGGYVKLTANEIDISIPDITTSNQPIAIQGNVTLSSPTSPIIFKTGNAPITLTGLVDGNLPLTLDSGTGNVSITGAIGGVNPIGNLTVNSTGITTFGGPISAASLTTNGGGTTLLNGNVTTTGAAGQVYGDNVTTTSDITFTGNALTFGGTVSGTGNLSFNTGTIKTLPGSPSVMIEATNDITIQDLVNNSLSFQSGTGAITFTADADENGSGSFVMQDINDTILAPGRNLSISGASITTGTLTTGAINGGSINLTATNGSIQTGNLVTTAYASSGVAGNGGAITLNATAGITTTGWIQSTSESIGTANSSDGGNITIITSSGDIQIPFTIHSASVSNRTSANGGNIVLQAPNGSIYTHAISTASRSWSGTAAGNGGSVNIEAGNLFSITNLDPYWVGIGTDSGGATGSSNGGPINLTAPQIELSSLLGIEATLVGIDTTPGMYTTNQPIAIQGNVTLSSPTSPIIFKTGNAPITLTGLVDGNLPLTLNSGTGNVSITGAIGSVNPIADLTVNSTGITTFGGPISAASLTTNAGGTTQLNGNVTTTGAAGQVYGDNVTTSGDIRLSGNEISFGGPIAGTGTLTLQPATVTNPIALGNATDLGTGTLDITSADLAAIQGFTSLTIGRGDGSGEISSSNLSLQVPTTIQSGSGAITLNGEINGGQPLTITAQTGDITFLSGAMGNTTPLLNVILDTGGMVRLANSITTNGSLGVSITGTSGINLTGPVTINTSGGNGAIALTGAINGSSSSGGGANSSSFPSSSLGMNAGAGVVTLDQSVGSSTPLTQLAVTGGNITAAGDLFVDSDGINLTGDNINLTNVTTTGGGQVAIANSGNLNLNGLLNLDGSFSQTGTGPVFVTRDLITTNDPISFNSPVTLMEPAAFNAGTGTLSFNNTISAGSNDLNLTANDMEFGGEMSGTGTVFLNPGSSDRNIQIGGTPSSTALNLSATELNQFQPGWQTIFIGNTQSTGTLTIAPVTLANHSYVFNGGNGTIVVEGLLQGTSGAGFSFNGSAIQLAGNIQTEGTDITFSGDVTLGADVTLSTGLASGGAIRFDAPVDGPHQLTLEAGLGPVNLESSVGGISLLSGVKITANTTTLASSLAAIGDVILNSDLSVLNNATISSQTGNLQFNQQVNSQDSPGNLSLSAPAGTITFNQAVGSLFPLAQLEVTEAMRVIANAPLNANSLSLSGNTIQLNHPVTTTGGDVNITANNQLTVGDITTSGGGIRVINNTGNTNAGNLDSSNPSGTGGQIAIEAPNGATLSGNLTSTGQTGGTIRIVAQNYIQVGNIDASGTLGNGGNVFIDPENDTEVGYINAQGGASGIGGDIFIQTGQFFRAANTFSDRNGQIASISNAGGQGGGSITLNHGGGESKTRFAIGDNSINGTAGVITTGTDTFALGESFLDSVSRGSISLVTSDVISPEEPPPKEPITPEPPPEEPPTPEPPRGETPADPGSSPTMTADPTDPLPPVSDTSEPPSEAPTPETPTEPGSELPQNEESEPTIAEPGLLVEEPSVPLATEEPPPIAIAPASVQVPPIEVETVNPPPLTVEPTTPTVEISPLPSPEIPPPLPSLEIPPPLNPEPQISPVQTVIETVQSGIDSDRGETVTGPLSVGSGDTVSQSIETEIGGIEDGFTDTFSQHSGMTPTATFSLPQAQGIMRKIETETGVKPALIYVRFAPLTLDENRQNDQLEILLVTSDGKAIPKRIAGTSREQIKKAAIDFRVQLTGIGIRRHSYLQTAQKLYDWIIAPIEEELQAQQIHNLAFVMDAGLRSLPIAALHDGNQFLIEKYSVGMMPSLSLTDTRYVDIKHRAVLAMGASEFAELAPLPGVPAELQTITQKVSTGEYFLNEAFTIDNLKKSRQAHQYSIVHLATHGEFQSGELSNSYIQLWDRKLKLDEIRELGFSEPPVELLVLSACRTAVGDEQAELGFAGLAVQAGVKTALASLWYVSDEGTFGLMSEFYHQLTQAPIKAEALRQTQIAMIQGKVRIENGILYTSNQEIPLPESVSHLNQPNFSHPYYWAAFTMIGSPW